MTALPVFAQWFAITKYDPNLEQDVQDVFIISLALSSSSQLQVSNEAGRHFTIDPTTQKVSGDTTGCSGRSSSGCSYAPGSSQTSWLLLLVVCGLVLLLGVRRKRFARSQRGGWATGFGSGGGRRWHHWAARQ